MTVDGKAGACKGGCTQRRFVYALDGVAHARKIAAEHFHIGHAVMAEGDGLRGLEMGETRHDCCRVFFRALQKRFDQVFEGGCGFFQFLLHPETEIDGHLVIARTGGVEAPGGRADQFRQPRLDVHVNVFELAREGEFALFYFLADGFQAIFNLFVVFCRNDARLCEHGCMGERALNILRIELAVETD